MLIQSITRNSLILAIFALCTAGALALTFSSTKSRIAEQQRLAAAKALVDIVPLSRHDNDMLSDTWAIPDKLLAKLGLSEPSDIHIATNAGKPVAIIVPTTAPDGYSGDIHLLIGINTDSSIAGVRVLSHKETPGLGDKIDLNKSDWILGFDTFSLQNPEPSNWKVKKDGGQFDQFTGATITPRAVVQRVKQTLEFYAAHKADVLAYIENKGQNNE